MFTPLKKKVGMSLVEVIIASAIILVISVVLVSANFAYYRTSNTNLKTTKAIYLIEQGLEAVNFIKNNDWNSLGTIGTDYYLTWNGSNWVATTTEVLVDQNFRRIFFTEEVNRDSNDDIATNGFLDQNTRRLTVQVSWSDVTSGTTTKGISSYIFKPND